MLSKLSVKGQTKENVAPNLPEAKLMEDVGGNKQLMFIIPLWVWLKFSSLSDDGA